MDILYYSFPRGATTFCGPAGKIATPEAGEIGKIFTKGGEIRKKHLQSAGKYGTLRMDN